MDGVEPGRSRCTPTRGAPCCASSGTTLASSGTTLWMASTTASAIFSPGPRRRERRGRGRDCRALAAAIPRSGGPGRDGPRRGAFAFVSRPPADRPVVPAGPAAARFPSPSSPPRFDARPTLPRGVPPSSGRRSRSAGEGSRAATGSNEASARPCPARSWRDGDGCTARRKRRVRRGGGGPTAAERRRRPEEQPLPPRRQEELRARTPRPTLDDGGRERPGFRDRCDARTVVEGISGRGAGPRGLLRVAAAPGAAVRSRGSGEARRGDGAGSRPSRRPPPPPVDGGGEGEGGVEERSWGEALSAAAALPLRGHGRRHLPCLPGASEPPTRPNRREGPSGWLARRASAQATKPSRWRWRSVGCAPKPFLPFCARVRGF